MTEQKIIHHRRNAEFYEEITRQHEAHVAAKWPPLRAIAIAYGVTRGTASNWITQARALGYDVSPCSHLRHHYAYSIDRKRKA